MKKSNQPKRWQRYTRFIFKSVAITALSLFFSFTMHAQKQAEYLGRGVVAVRTSSSSVYIGWRLLGTDPTGIAFNLYRGTTKVNTAPITASTNYVDNIATNNTYTVRPVINDVEQTASAGASVLAQQYLTLNLQIPPAGTTPAGGAYTYSPNDCSVADLDGDGEYEIVVLWNPSNAQDNSIGGYTGNVYIDGYKMNGTRLWRINLGHNIRAGAHYTQLMVYDLDGDGKAELAVKTADGTVSGTGQVIGSASADYRNSNGYILSGPEFLTIFNGQTGAAMATTNFIPARGNVADWGDSYGNRVDRFVSTIAYVDGARPSLIMGRGYYTRMVRAAWDWRNGTLTNRWTFDSNSTGNSSYKGNGNHQLSVADGNGDGKHDIYNGSSTISGTGTGLYSNKLGHGDALHVSDMNPDRPGQEVFMCYESMGESGNRGLGLTDAATGALLWSVPATGDTGRALTADIDPRYKGFEMWGAVGGLYTCTGTQITTTRPTMSHLLWWDGDVQREILNGEVLDKWNSSTNTSNRIMSFSDYGVTNINTTKENPNITADIFGDWREEVVLRTTDNTKLLIFTTTIPATNRFYTFMHDIQYRCQVAGQPTAYNQPPHTSFYFGGGMAAPPKPNIYLVGVPAPPAAPTGLIATNGNAKVDLAWTSSSASISYNVLRSATAGGPYTTIAANVTTAAYSDTGLTNETTYHYVVRGVNAGGESPNSNQVSATPTSVLGSSIIIQENSTGYCGANGTIDNNNLGFTGTGFVNATNEVDAGVNWRVNASTAGNYTLTWRHANGSGVNRPARLLINGSVVGSTINFAGTTNYTTWEDVSLSIALSEGDNSIRLESTTVNGLSNIDYLKVTGTTPTPSSICTTPSLTIEESTTGYCSAQGTIDNNNLGFTGSGFVNTNNTIGDGITWRINVITAGTYTLQWRHANGSGVNRSGKLLINGTQSISSIDFPATASFTAWEELSINIPLSAGQNTIRLEATTANGLANIDYLKVSGTSTPTVLSCSGITSKVANEGLKLMESNDNNAVSSVSIVYPNPSAGTFNLKSAGQFTYRISDLLGRVLEKGSGVNEVTVGNNLSKGIYLITINKNNKMETFKVIKL